MGRERDIEREQIEQVFGLTGGELSDQPWEVEGYRPMSSHPHWRPARGLKLDRLTFNYWYEGVPEWAESDYRDRYQETYRTVVYYGVPAAAVRDGQDIWQRVNYYVNSGETECPGMHEDENRVTHEHTAGDTVCALCEADLGDEHGYIYLGDGWVEAVYKLQKARYEESEDEQLEPRPRSASARRPRTPMQGHGRPVDYGRRRLAVAHFYIVRRDDDYARRRHPGKPFYIALSPNDERMLSGDYGVGRAVPGEYATEAEAEATARRLFPRARRI